MIKYKLIQLPDATIVVSDEEITNNDWVIDNRDGMNNFIHQFSTNFKNELVEKIIAGLQNLHAIKYNLSDEDAKKIGYVDLDKLAEEQAINAWGGYIDDTFKHDDIITDKTLRDITIEDFTAGFQKAMELNDKKFSEAELLMVSNYLKTDSLDEVLKFLKMPQIFDCEIEITDCITVTKIL